MPYLGELSALITALLWSGTSIAFSSAAERIGSLQLNISRLIFASIFLFTTIAVFGLPTNLSMHQILMLAASGIIGLVLGDSFLFKAYVLIGARLGILFLSASPAIAAVLAFFFLGESLTTLSFLGMAITMTGISLVILKRDEKSQEKYKVTGLGIFYGFMAAVGQAGGLIFAKFAFNESPINGFTATFIRIFTSTIILLPFGILTQKFKNPVNVYLKDKKAFALTILGTIIGPYLGITFSLIAVSNTQVGIASTLMSTMPVIMLPMVKIVYKEKLNWAAVLGAFLAVAGIAILFVK